MPTIARRLDSTTAVFTALATVAILFSIALSQILIGLALLSLLLSRHPLQFSSRVRYPMLAFVGWTLLSLAFSDAPISGLPLVRKIFLYLIPVLVYNAYQNRRQIQRTFQGLAIAGTIAALYGLWQFVRYYMAMRRAGRPIYESYVAQQITGFMSHWMTYAGELMLIMVLLVSLLLFFRPKGISGWWWFSIPVVVLALLASFTRGVWLGTLAGIIYLLLRCGRRGAWLLVPAVILMLYFLAPSWLQQRERSIFNTETDNHNRLRLLMLYTGARMIQAHPLFGVGPERVGSEFLRYKPASMPLPPGSWYGHLHNDFLQIAAERGVPCLLFFLWFLFEITREGLLLARSRLPEVRAMGHTEVAATLALMVGGLFEFNFGDSEVLMLFLFLIATAYTWTRLEVPVPARAETLSAAHLPSVPSLQTLKS